MNKAKALIDRCNVTRFEAMVIRAWNKTITKPLDKRVDAVEKHQNAFNETSANPDLVQRSIWAAVQSLLKFKKAATDGGADLAQSTAAPS